MDDSLGDGKPDASPLEFRGVMEALKSSEEFVIVFHVEAYTLVLHIVNIATDLLITSYLDFNPFPVG